MPINFAHILRDFFPVALMVLLGTYPCFGDTLVNFKDGRQIQAQDLITKGNILVYVGRECPICHQYLQNLFTCRDLVRENLQIVSLSTPAQTKELARTISGKAPLYLIKDQKVAKSALVTPTTRIGKLKIVGNQDCDHLEKLISTNQNISRRQL